ncbi:exopolysaccharide biosynthesis polyprenyl glycosylphosphotransferase [Caldicoprobacter faecalis]|uniref:Exopolysaccharide biosynthesis polyprenyl glycosylphosphotransferase n=2 Tax=Caldicoprobacter faecalis TaxID=937334 RepID=A0A1I5XQ90_9FIRM|nr:exopolysaccharide biosynthesis polyprenyl glycosylphosphotransferase [Caldicoprobacter faecalis]
MEVVNIEMYVQRNIGKNTTVVVENRFWYEKIKRVMDIVLSLIGLVIAIPLMLIFGIAIKLESKGPVFYCQERVGKNGKVFMLYKLRSMYQNAEENGAKWAEKDDPRVTKVGRIMRKTRIDELPQLFNVLKGDMSIVGPRPERPIFTYQFNEQIPGFVNRLQVKPGLTGWAQVNGGYELGPAEKLEYDLYYIENRSIWMDIKIMLKTVKVILTGKGAW